jgi:hypothetical protein
MAVLFRKVLRSIMALSSVCVKQAQVETRPPQGRRLQAGHYSPLVPESQKRGNSGSQPVWIFVPEPARSQEGPTAKGCMWNQPYIVQAAKGERMSGFDYYQKMMLWSLPAALEGADLRRPCASGGVLHRVIQAGRKA